MDIRKKLAGKVLFWDIENTPNTVATFGIGHKVSIGHNQVLEHSKIICISYKDPGWKKAKVLKWDVRKKCDKAMLKQFVKIANKYEILIAHNGDAFDLKVFKGRLYANKIKPLTNVLTLDTLKLSRKNFRIPSHRLDYHSKLNGHSGKDSMCFEDWLHITYEPHNSKKYIDAMNKMVKYNIKDTDILEGVFFDMLPYCDTLPIHLGLLISGNKEGCPKCGEDKSVKWGSYTTKSNVYQKLYCKGCGHVYKGSIIKQNNLRLVK